MIKLTKEEQEEYDRLKERISAIESCLDSAVDNDQPIPFNLILEGRHNALSCRIIEIKAQIAKAQADSVDEESIETLKARLQMNIAKAREVGRMNGLYRDIAITYREFTFYNL